MPTPGRAHPGHGHAVRLCRAHGISHAHGELATPHNTEKKTIPTFVIRWLPNEVEPWQAGFRFLVTIMRRFDFEVVRLFLPTMTAKKLALQQRLDPRRSSFFIHLYIVTVFPLLQQAICELCRGSGWKSGISLCTVDHVFSSLTALYIVTYHMGINEMYLEWTRYNFEIFRVKILCFVTFVFPFIFKKYIHFYTYFLWWEKIKHFLKLVYYTAHLAWGAG